MVIVLFTLCLKHPGNVVHLQSWEARDRGGPETGKPVLADEATRPFEFPCVDGVEKAISIFCENLSLAVIFP